MVSVLTRARRQNVHFTVNILVTDFQNGDTKTYYADVDDVTGKLGQKEYLWSFRFTSEADKIAHKDPSVRKQTRETCSLWWVMHIKLSRDSQYIASTCGLPTETILAEATCSRHNVGGT